MGLPRKRFRQGAASFYVVAFSTLILVVITASFIAVVLSGLARTANDELAQSAYDAALAGIEDAKVAFSNYQKCVKSGAKAKRPNMDGIFDCGEIIYLVDNPNCDMVGKILGRIPDSNSGGVQEVLVEETSEAGNNMQQAYTCVKLDMSLSDYRFEMGDSDETTKAIRVRIGGGKGAKDVNKVTISWWKNNENDKSNFSNFSGGKNFSKIAFPSFNNEKAVPPMVSVGLVQTASQFTIDQFEEVYGAKTNRGTVYLVPTNDRSVATRTQENAYKDDEGGNYIGAGENGTISANQIVKTNDHAVKNLPFAVYCPSDNGDDEFACSATLDLPGVIGGERSDETFMIVVSIPYGGPETEFSLEFKDKDGQALNLSGMQVGVDSTGRANNLFRRVEARLEPADTSFTYPLFGLELLGDDSSESLLKKPKRVECEYTFSPTC